jgi:aminomethyltransferase
VLRKSPFFDFLNRRKNTDFEAFCSNAIEDTDYIEWNGFLLAHDYGDAAMEYRAIRQSCAIFDVSPLRKYRISGADSGAFLDRLLTRPVSSSSSMRSIYVLFCNDDGSLKDDAILYKYDDDDYLLMPSDIDHLAHFDSLIEKADLRQVSIIDCTHSMIGFALQGPTSTAAMLEMGFEGIEQLKPFVIRDYPLADGMVRVVRMGFTADLGYECWFQPQLRQPIEQALRSVRASSGLAMPGYGLSALQACRLEGGFIVAGWDCSTEADPQPGFERTPYELGLGWMVNLDEADFVGREALLEKKRCGSRFTLRSIEIDDPRSLRDGASLYALTDGEDTRVGSVNCSAWSETLNSMIGNASIESQYADIQIAWVRHAGESVPARLSRPPLLSFDRARQVPAPIQKSPGEIVQ